MSYSYIVDLNVTRGNLSYAVVDYVGNSFDATVLSNGSVQFILNEDWQSVVLAGTTEGDEVELTYKAEALSDPDVAESETPSTATTAAEPSETDDAAFSVRAGGAAMSAAVACAIVIVLNQRVDT